MLTISEELHRVYEKLEEYHFGYYPGIGGEEIYFPPSREAEELMAWAEVLIEVSRLHLPVGETKNLFLEAELGCDWGLTMHMGQCPCPGVPREYWDQGYDEHEE